MSAERSQRKRRDWRRRYVTWPLEAAALASLLGLLAILPRRAAAWLGGAVARFVGPWFSHQHARAISRNIAIAFPELTLEERDALQRRIWRHFGRVLSTYPHFPPLLRRPDLGGAIEIEGTQHLADAARSGRFILVGAHFGHFEVAPCYATVTGCRISGLYTSESNPWIDRLMRYLRNRAGGNVALIARGSAAVRHMIGALRRGGGLFIIVDQRVDDGEWVPFFGRPAQTTTTPARLARRVDCPIVLCRTILLPKGRYRITYYEPLRPDPSREADADILVMTQSINRSFESWIREYPEQWLCTKRRWPKDRVVPQIQPAQPKAEAKNTRARARAAVDQAP